jgi:uncharacterized protein
MVLRTSSYLHSCRHSSGRYVVYHRFLGQARILEPEIYAHLVNFEKIDSHAVKPDDYLTQEWEHIGYLVPSDIDEKERVLANYRSSSQPVLKNINFQISNACNFRCHNCIHFEGVQLPGRQVKPTHMDQDLATRAIDWLAQDLINKKSPDMGINFAGGEAMLNWRVIRHILEYTTTRYAKQLKLRFSINTNASLVTPDIARILKAYDVHILTSLDGLKAANDLNRQTVNGRSTFEQTLKGFDTLAEGGLSVKALHVTLTPLNQPYLNEQFVSFLKHRGIISITLEPDLTDHLHCSPEELVNTVMEFKKLARTFGITVTGYWERPFGNCIESLPNTKTHFCRAMAGESIDFHTDGAMHSCSYTDRHMGYLDDFITKGPDALVGSDLFSAMVHTRQVGSIEACEGCCLEGVCGGGCYATQVFSNQHGDMSRFDYRCEFYRQITDALLMDAVDQILDAQDLPKKVVDTHDNLVGCAS